MAKISKSYAKSFLQMNFTSLSSLKKDAYAETIKRKVKESLKELCLLATAISTSSNIYSFFKNPLNSESDKYNVLINLFPQLKAETLSLLKLLTETNDLKLIPEIFQEYEKLAEKFSESASVKLTLASKLQKNLGPILLKNLKNLTKTSNILLEVDYKKTILGGIILEYGSVSLDASILREFRAFLAN